MWIEMNVDFKLVFDLIVFNILLVIWDDETDILFLTCGFFSGHISGKAIMRCIPTCRLRTAGRRMGAEQLFASYLKTIRQTLKGNRSESPHGPN
jgi:hypothetical protein